MSVYDLKTRKRLLLTSADLVTHRAEACIASIVVQAPERLPELLELLDLDALSCEPLRELVQEAAALHRRDGSMSLDALALHMAARRVPVSSSVLCEVWTLCAPYQSFRPFVEAVEGQAVTRRVRECMDALAVAVDEGGDIAEHVQALQAAGALRSRADIPSMLDVMDAELGVMQSEWDGQGARRWSTSLPGIDRVLNGGLKAGQLVVIGGRPGAGKSAMGIQIADAIASAGGRVHVYTGEMTRGEVARRVMSLWSDAPGHELQQPSTMRQATMDRIVDDVDAVRRRGYRMRVDDRAGLSWGEVVPGIMRSAFAMGGLDLVLVDYLQLLRVPERQTEYTEYSAASKAAKALAKSLGCVVVLLCQLNRANAQRAKKSPIISDLRATGQIEQDANVILFPYRPQMDDEDAPPDLAQIDVAKHREGRTGVVAARWVGQFTRYEAL